MSFIDDIKRAPFLAPGTCGRFDERPAARHRFADQARHAHDTTGSGQ